MTIEQRLERLERQNRFLKMGGAAILLVVLGVATMGASQQEAIPDVVKARAFHVVGKDGTALVKLEDSLGTERGVGGTVTTYNAAGQSIVLLEMTMDGDGMVTTWNGKGKKLVRLAVAEGGEGAVVTMNGKGKELVRLGVAEGGEGVVTTRNAEGKDLVKIGVSTNGVGLVTVFDPSGRRGFGRLAPR